MSELSTKFDSTNDTKAHIRKVDLLLYDVAILLRRRGFVHDASKLVDPEKSEWDRVTPKLAELEYGSEEYKQNLRDIRPTIEHHYAHNSHHPEFYGERGINGMSLLDVIEMLCDWKAASERTKQRMDGDTYKNMTFLTSLEYNKTRYNISDQLYEILVNTAKELGFDGS